MKRSIGQKNIFVVTLLVLISFSLSGCFYLILGTAAAAGGYAISQDTIQGETEKDFEEVWDAAVNIISILGTINSKSSELGKITATVNGAKVTISVIQLTSSTVRLKVKARKFLFPTISAAQNIFVKIMNRANE